jgi:hypothetical protein
MVIYTVNQLFIAHNLNLEPFNVKKKRILLFFFLKISFLEIFWLIWRHTALNLPNLHKNSNLITFNSIILLTLSLQDFLKLMSQEQQPGFSLAINYPFIIHLLTAIVIFRTQYDVANE